MELLDLIERWWVLLGAVFLALLGLLRLMFPTRQEYNKRLEKVENRVLWLEAGNPVTDRARKKKHAIAVHDLDSTVR